MDVARSHRAAARRAGRARHRLKLNGWRSPVELELDAPSPSTRQFRAHHRGHESSVYGSTRTATDPTEQ